MPIAERGLLVLRPTLGAAFEGARGEFAGSVAPYAWAAAPFESFISERHPMAHEVTGDAANLGRGCGCPACGRDFLGEGPQYFMPPTSGVAENGLPIYNWDQAALQLTRHNVSWSFDLGSPVTVSYGFRSTAPFSMPDDTAGFSRFSAAQIAAAELALQLWSDVANITFVRVGSGTTGEGAYTNNATILFSNYSSGAEGASAFAYYPWPTQTGAAQVEGDVWVNISLASNQDMTFGEFGLHTLTHEIGHAIGLAHPGDYDSLSGEPITYPESADYWQDSRAYTVMSYFGSAGVGHSLNAFAAGPQLHDIAAAQLLYGANMTTRTGDTVYGFNSNTGRAHYTITADGQSPVFAIWDAGGNDTIDFSGYSTATEIDLREQAFSSAGPGNGGAGVAIGNIAIARGAVIENGIGGSGADVITGNNVANRLRGNGGADTIDGMAGIDTSVYAIASTGASWTRNSNGTLTVTGQGTDTLTSVEVLDFSDRDVFIRTPNRSFSGDWTSDMLFVRDDGLLVSWSLNGTAISSSAILATVGPEWTALGTGDFDGDTRDDILFQRNDGLVFTWEMEGATIASAGAVTALGAEWSYLTTADFNGDRRDDIAWQNSDGLIVVWQMDGRSISGGGAVTALGTEWSLAGAGDFNSDGRDDFLWRRDDGLSFIWNMDGAAIAGASTTSAFADNSWSLGAVADINGDGYSDLIWQRNDGLIVSWQMQGATVTSSGVLASIDPSEWTLQTVGD
ncbi:MAG TPA: M10 family metallopeptidase C-terminal domain-containing protein, partial [Vitreimonas sp.]|uniref:M10 family metallopeptidase C-terminal domain-containing protein n=1 Tax=Vitreimonas sp. TaxID=3069702 RepID=UPI002D6752B0